MASKSIVIAQRFRGPPASANGGYTGGCVAEHIAGTAEVTLRAPPPLDVPLEVALCGDGNVELTRDGVLIAEARATQFELALPEPVELQTARNASARFIGFQQHPYPTCFVCGTERSASDGLTLFPGPVPGRKLVAAPWTPAAWLCDASGVVRPEYVWAALDCPSWFGHASFVDPVPPILLGRLAVHIERLPTGGQPCVIVGWSLGVEGRRILCASALHDAAGAYLAWSRATWVTLRAAG
jgi:hypothetical protein